MWEKGLNILYHYLKLLCLGIFVDYKSMYLTCVTFGPGFGFREIITEKLHVEEWHFLQGYKHKFCF